MRILAEVIQQLTANPETGLSNSDAQQSQHKFGKNRLTPLPREPLWKKFIEKFDEPIIKILLAAALLSMVVDVFKPPADSLRYALGGAVLGLAILAVVAAYVFKQQQWIPTIL